MQLRITPACAGTTFLCKDCIQFMEDHPRVCGNHLLISSQACGTPGSPPRVREPQNEAYAVQQAIRITPACAGTTYRHRSMLQMRRDHPRVCGNHSILFQIRFHSEGSPPRVREPLSGYVPMLSEIGITPACAGTTIVRAARARKPRDHPRVCGNHLEIHLAGDLCLGSPPRVREPLAVYLNYLIVFGITPACAGTTER